MELEIKLKATIKTEEILAFNNLSVGDFFCYADRLENERPNVGYYARFVRWAVYRKLSPQHYATSLHGKKQIFALKDRGIKMLYEVKMGSYDF